MVSYVVSAFVAVTVMHVLLFKKNKNFGFIRYAVYMYMQKIHL